MTIFLCGFMGCGKSTVGELTAQKLNCDFTDMDTYIEQQAGMKIPEIFEKFGEPHFRNLETQAVRDLSGRDGVIACGGGAMLREINAQTAQNAGCVVFLDVPFPVCFDRIKDSDRPIVKNSTCQQLEELYQKRYPVYQKHASHTVNASLNPEAVVSEILNLLGAEG